MKALQQRPYLPCDENSGDKVFNPDHRESDIRTRRYNMNT